MSFAEMDKTDEEIKMFEAIEIDLISSSDDATNDGVVQKLETVAMDVRKESSENSTSFAQGSGDMSNEAVVVSLQTDDSNHSEKESCPKPEKQNCVVRQYTDVEYGALRSEIAKKKKDRLKTASSRMGEFFTLTAGAELLFPTVPVLRANPKELAKKPQVKDAPSSSESQPDRSSTKRKKAEKEKPDTLICEICDVPLSSLEALATHELGKKHQKKLAVSGGFIPNDMQCNPIEMKQWKVEESIPLYRSVKHGVLPQIQTHLDRLDTPLIGLDYITEICLLNKSQDPIYVCEVCNSVCQMVTIVSHVSGYKHRLHVLKCKKPFIYERVKKTCKKSELTRCLEEAAIKLEEEMGRGRIIVQQEEKQPPDFDCPRASYQPAKSSVPEQEPSPFNLEDVGSLPTEVRIEMFHELAKLSPREIGSSSHAYRLSCVLYRLRQELRRYREVGCHGFPNYSLPRNVRIPGGSYFGPMNPSEPVPMNPRGSRQFAPRDTSYF